MLGYAARRLLQIIITFFIILSIVFFLFRIMPGDPTSMIISPKFSAEDRQRLRVAFGLDKPLLVQYLLYIKNILRLDFGASLISGRSVVTVISERIPATVLLFLSANILSFIIGKKIGEIMAWHRGKAGEKILTLFSITAYTTFFPWLALLLIWIFAYWLSWFPLGGMITVDKWVQGGMTWWAQFLDVAWHMILPLTTLIFVRFAGPALVMRSSMIENLDSDFITTARAKGLTERKVRQHASRNSLLPLMTGFILSFAYSLSGSVLVETVFNWPGLGQLIVASSLQQDYPVVQFSFLILALGVLLMNLLADLMYSHFDPRVRLD